MDLRIADTFTDSLARLSGDEQKAAKTTAFDLQLSPANPGMSFHKLDRAKDKHFWSVRVSDDIRIIVHRTESSLLLCYVDHHDRAYQWAERRRLETHPKTGAAQLVEIRERVEEIAVPNYVESVQPAPARPLLFAGIAEDTLLGYGVPREWLADVLGATEDSLLALADHLPGEAAEALLELATGGTPKAAPVVVPEVSPFDHPDAQRRFRVMGNVEELERALSFPWDKWTVFLHPAQREWVERDYNGPARVSGSAGTGKTIVALHRAVYLARRHPEARVLLATFSDTLASALRTRLRRLIGSEPRLGERLEVLAMDALAERLYAAQFGPAQIASPEQVQALLATAVADVGGMKFSPHFLLGEWLDVVDAWQLESWEAYRDVRRLGRKTRLAEAQRAALWAVFERVRAALRQQGLLTHAQLFNRLTGALSSRPPPFDFAVIDECQDIGVAQLRFLAALGGERANALFFAGDLGQRIFQQPFSWKALGVDIRGRARTLHVNYRTSHQIRRQADRLLGPQVADVDGNTEERGGTVSVFNGPNPQVVSCADEAAEISAVARWLEQRTRDGVPAREIVVIVRSQHEVPRASAALVAAQIPWRELDERVDTQAGFAALCTMPLAKGLEFRAVAVMACDDEVIPLQQRIESIADGADLDEVYSTERHLLYVACTRARDQLLVTGVAPTSEFLDDLKATVG
jgi:mRNA-degrading endonuclease RelE of RelBE toxin-antitoxin system